MQRFGHCEEVMEYTNSQITALIDDHIHNERDRDILKRRLVDGITYERIAAEFDLSTRHVKSIIYKSMNVLAKRL